MVATRRGTRVGSPVKDTSDENSGATQPTTSTRRTRRRTLMEENQPQSEFVGNSQPDEPKDDSTASSSAASLPKCDIRRSTRLLADKKQPNSTHEADVSESESCCSVVSDVQVTPRTRRRTAVRGKPTVQDEASEVESCSSEVSATHSRRAPYSLRKRVLTSAAAKDATKDDDDDPSGAESCSSSVSVTKAMDTRPITRSHRKTAVPSTEADSSEPESCSSSVSGLRGSVVRRSARNQKVKPTEPIPLSFEETTDTPSSPMSRKSASRRKTVVDDKTDSDGYKSGPSMSPWRSTRRQPKPDTLVGESNSESVATDVCTSQGSPSPQRGRGTPCSSRTGSASSSCAVPVTRTRSKAKVASHVSDTITTAAAMPEEPGEGLETPHESIPVPDGDEAEDTVDQLDSTVTMDTSEAQECTMIEERAEDTTVVLDQDEAIEMQEPQSSMQDVEPVEDRGTETLTLQEKPAAETSATLTEESGEVAMENDEPEFVETSHVVKDHTCSEPVKEDTAEAAAEDPVPAVIEDKVDREKKGVIVYEEANDTVKTTENNSVPLNDLEGPSTSSHTQTNLTITEETSKKPPPQKQMISLLDSSEDEDSADEGLSSEEEGCSHKAEDVQSEDDVMCPDGNQVSEEAEAHGKGLFVIDTKPGLRSKKQYYVDAKQTEEEDEEDFVDEDGDDDDDEDSKVLFAPKKPLIQLSSAIDTGLKMKELGGLYISFDGNKPKSLSNSSKSLKDLNNQDELLKKSVIVPEFEKKDAVPPYSESKHAAKLKRKAEREKTTGDGWFNMRAPELTEELKNDLKALKMRSAMDPKRFYKKNDREGFPKYFQVGTVVDNPVDFYSSRIPKKQRKRTIVEELLADAEFRSYNKKKYQEIMAEKAAQAAGKMNKKKHMFHKKKTNK
ncbi:deoxynucleotidyltransferase terminal-interacting protein 2-like isoform X2 [Sinocyclocheilus rhinocerous]|uniref:deoxynucleotidyltransferase terminal-interacting protein 2-like isoform X2 n=1 Tax=Sinocyclocheilus rhinocerous TaxID=307959 RepID=UPI0007B96A58|nr:PREDICTED: deoxynucleotidyltransferase terminal-interacting protein 2-like isoform X2 [Sinocyclocheilus rhinocerous]